MHLFLCASITSTRSWKEQSSLVIVLLYAVARASALSLQSFDGVRFLTAAFTCWYSGWSLQPEYQQVKAAVKNLTTINDCSERALALATAYSGTMTKDDCSFQDLVLIVETHRKGYKIKKKKQLKETILIYFDFLTILIYV